MLLFFSLEECRIGVKCLREFMKYFWPDFVSLCNIEIFRLVILYFIMIVLFF